MSYRRLTVCVSDPGPHADKPGFSDGMSRIAPETGTHSPRVSRQLARMDHEVIVAHARNVRLIGESSRKDDQLDARTLARLAQMDHGLLGPVRHRSAEAQIQLTAIRARAALVSSRTAPVYPSSKSRAYVIAR